MDSYQLGRLTLGLTGGLDPIARYVDAELHALPEGKGPPDVCLEFPADPRSPAILGDEVQVGGVTVSPRGLSTTIRRFNVCLDFSDPSMWHASVSSLLGAFKYQPANGAVRLLDASFLNAHERLAKTFFYAIFDTIIQARQLSLGQSWVHASGLKNGDRTVAFMAWGGVGKTSVMLKLMERGAWKFLSDDLMIVDDDGNVYVTPKRMQIYAYNLTNEPTLRGSLLDGRSVLDRLQFGVRERLLGSSKARRRVSASELFGKDRVASEGRLTDAVVMRRGSGSAFSTDVISTSVLANVVADTLMHELHIFGTLIASLGASAVTTPLPSYPETHALVVRIVRDALRGLGPQGHSLVTVPKGAGPTDIADYMTTALRL